MHDQEIRESMDRIHDLRPHCPRCKCEMIRVFNAPGIHYKGDGWTKKAKRQKGDVI